ncbi:VCBS repeat-containing protein [Coraliomargarita sp. SDUM461004]|uniref:VCBS repeat-containing protein n=1 Tax=Thalassobacterium sedimentorum TaxID=3041258 RepID=A0ABU1AHW6_9BACT|nr:VCBS repeat-containing protein [Coraliomargarita sp. SDUM461004]MDQ8193773.1 VCBS repeat-containing protein [Coraliomargarita sp. SDUM461004]
MTISRLLCLITTIFLASNLVAEVIFYSDFNDGFTASIARGNATPVIHDDLKQSDAQALRVRPNHFLRYDAKDNIEPSEGTLHLRFKPNFNGTETAPNYSQKAQHLFGTRLRSGPWINAYIDLSKDDTPAVVFAIAANTSGAKKLRLPFILEENRWYTLILRWKHDGKVSLQLDQAIQSEPADGMVPTVPSSFLGDLFVGTNTKQILRGPYGDIGHFDGWVDDLIIDNQVDADVTTVIPPTKVVSHPLPQQPWQLETHNRRLRFQLQDLGSQKGTSPIKAKITLNDEWLTLSSAQKRAAIRSFRLINLETPETHHPFRIDDSFYWTNTGTLRWSHSANASANYALYYDLNAADWESSPKSIPMIGNGDRLMLGKKDEIHLLSGTLRGHLQAWDADGDGDLDLWFQYGDLRETNDEFRSGHYYYENLGPEKPNIYAAPQLIIRHYPPYVELKRTNRAMLGDLNRNGAPDLLLINSTGAQWSEFEMQAGRPVITAHHQIHLSKELRSKEPHLIDWDHDGNLELVLGNEVYRFEMQNDKQLILNPTPIAILEHQSESILAFVDWENDGDWDIISEVKREVKEMPYRNGRGGNIQRLTIPTVEINDGSNNFAPPVEVKLYDGHEIDIPGVFFAPTFVDYDNDGDLDMLWSNDRAMIGYNENISFDSLQTPLWRPTTFLQQEERSYLDPGALAVPVFTDWDDDGDLDLIIGAAHEHIEYFENVGSQAEPIWLESERMMADNAIISLRAGPYGSHQGPQENDWAYTQPKVVDWNGDGLKDLIVSGIDGRHRYFKNIGQKGRPKLTRWEFLEVDWGDKTPQFPDWLNYDLEGHELVTAHRSQPEIIDWDGDGQLDYITLDHTNHLALYRGQVSHAGTLRVLPGEQIFKIDAPYRHIVYLAQASPEENYFKSKLNFFYFGRTSTSLVDWDGDGDHDLIWNNLNSRLLENVSDDTHPEFRDRGNLLQEHLEAHNNTHDVLDWDGDGKLDLFITTETGATHYFNRKYIDQQVPQVQASKVEVKTK